MLQLLCAHAVAIIPQYNNRITGVILTQNPDISRGRLETVIYEVGKSASKIVVAKASC
jgi:hypothetical protein